MKWAVISDCTPPNVLGSAVATNAAMEGVFSALVGGPLVGYLSQEMFGYTLPPLGTAVADMDPAVRTANAGALGLGQALFYIAATPWTLCFMLYTLIHWTYPRDCTRAEALAATMRQCT
jgi:hypothetical protein